MDPLLAKTLIDALADDDPRHRRSPRRPTPHVAARVRVATVMRRLADHLEPRAADPTVCTA